MSERSFGCRSCVVSATGWRCTHLQVLKCVSQSGSCNVFAVQSLSCYQVDVFGANLLNSDPQTFRFCIHLSEVWNLKRSCVREPSSITALFLISCGPAAIRITFNRTRRRRWILRINTILLLFLFLPPQEATCRFITLCLSRLIIGGSFHQRSFRSRLFSCRVVERVFVDQRGEDRHHHHHPHASAAGGSRGQVRSSRRRRKRRT